MKIAARTTPCEIRFCLSKYFMFTIYLYSLKCYQRLSPGSDLFLAAVGSGGFHLYSSVNVWLFFAGYT